MMTKLSVIIPHHNNYEQVNAITRSLHKYRDVEVLLVCDSLIYCEREKFVTSDNVGHLENNSNKKGAGASRNVGLDGATGEHIIFVDSDDFVSVSTVLEIIDRNLVSDVIFTRPMAQMLNDQNLQSNRHIKYVEMLDNFEKSRDRSSLLSYYVPWSKIYLGSFIRENGLRFEESVASNDVVFSVRCLNLARSIKVDEARFYTVTESAQSLTRSWNKEIAQSRFEQLAILNEYIRKDTDFNLIPVSGQLKNILFNIPHYFPYYLLKSLIRRYPIFFGRKHVMSILKRYFLQRKMLK